MLPNETVFYSTDSESHMIVVDLEEWIGRISLHISFLLSERQISVPNGNDSKQKNVENSVTLDNGHIE